MIELEATSAALSCELAGGKNYQLVDFPRCEVHVCPVMPQDANDVKPQRATFL